jgi:hypothetical protein
MGTIGAALSRRSAAQSLTPSARSVRQRIVLCVGQHLSSCQIGISRPADRPNWSAGRWLYMLRVLPTHSGSLHSQRRFASSGAPEPGRYVGKIKGPILQGLSACAPFLHDGSAKTLLDSSASLRRSLSPPEFMSRAIRLLPALCRVNVPAGR